MVKRGLTKAFNEAEERVKKDELGVYDQRLHNTEEPIEFSVIKRYPSGMPWVPLKMMK